MKKIILILTSVFAFGQLCIAQDTSIAPAKPGAQYGKKIETKDAISIGQLQKELNKKPIYKGKVTGEVVEVCKKKGCFMTLKIPGSTETVMVRFTDYGFFMPPDIIGKTVVLAGNAKVKETSIDKQKHYAADLGKSKEEIAKITEVKKELSIVADGVIVK